MYGCDALLGCADQLVCSFLITKVYSVVRRRVADFEKDLNLPVTFIPIHIFREAPNNQCENILGCLLRIKSLYSVSF